MFQIKILSDVLHKDKIFKEIVFSGKPENTQIIIVVAVELVPQRVNRRRSFSTLMLTLGDIVLVRLASNIILYHCNGNILIF